MSLRFCWHLKNDLLNKTICIKMNIQVCKDVMNRERDTQDTVF